VSFGPRLMPFVFSFFFWRRAADEEDYDVLYGLGFYFLDGCKPCGTSPPLLRIALVWDRLFSRMTARVTLILMSAQRSRFDYGVPIVPKLAECLAESPKLTLHTCSQHMSARRVIPL